MEYEYRFDRVELAIELPLVLRPKTDYHSLVETRAREGWRLVQVFAPSIFVLGGGIPDWFELIFEHPVATAASSPVLSRSWPEAVAAGRSWPGSVPPSRLK